MKVWAWLAAAVFFAVNCILFFAVYILFKFYDFGKYHASSIIQQGSQQVSDLFWFVAFCFVSGQLGVSSAA